MKRILIFVPVIAGLICFLLFAPQTAHAAEDVAINSTNFPDSIFRNFVKENFDINKDNKLSPAEIKSATFMTLSSGQISSLKGLEYLTNLKMLSCSYNQLTSLDVSKNTALTSLSCANNKLTSLDVSKNTALTDLDCYSNQLTTLDVSKNTALESLSCYRNQLTSLDVSKNTALTSLSCANNKLTSLDVSKNTALRYLNCQLNQLKSLDVTKNTALIDLYCTDNKLTTLDVTKNTALTDLSCTNNKLTALDISKNTALMNLYCYDNQLTLLNISKCPILLNLYKTWQKEESQDIITIRGDNYYDGLLRYDKTTIVITDENPFIDVNKADSFYTAVMWAVNNDITSGTSATTFSPNASCTRYQFAVMLYKLNGKPAVGNVTLPFTDVKKTDSYYNAVVWAYTNGIISGTTKTTFSPKDEVTRYQVVAMLYKSVGKPAISTTTNPFTDIKETDSYYKAVLWAVEKGITKGTSSTTFSPKATCKRYQMIVFLKKFNDHYHIK